MKALLLAAGLGTRLRPLTNKIPKCLVPISNRPLLDYWLDLLFSQGIEKVLINTHYFADQVEKYVASCRWSDRIELVYEEELLGTGGSIKANAAFFGNDSTCLIAHADNLTKFDLPAFQRKHEQRPSGTHMTLMTFETDNPTSCGIIEEDENGIVRGFHEKVPNPPGNYANGAIYILDQYVMSFIKDLNKKEIDFSTEVIPYFIGKMVTYHNDTYLRDIGSTEMLIRAERDIKEGLLS